MPGGLVKLLSQSWWECWCCTTADIWHNAEAQEKCFVLYQTQVRYCTFFFFFFIKVTSKGQVRCYSLHTISRWNIPETKQKGKKYYKRHAAYIKTTTVVIPNHLLLLLQEEWLKGNMLASLKIIKDNTMVHEHRTEILGYQL